MVFRGSFVLSDSLFFENLGGNAADIPGECQRCSSLCDDRFSCSGPTSLDCHKCAIAGIALNETAFVLNNNCVKYTYNSHFRNAFPNAQRTGHTPTKVSVMMKKKKRRWDGSEFDQALQ